MDKDIDRMAIDLKNGNDGLERALWEAVQMYICKVLWNTMKRQSVQSRMKATGITAEDVLQISYFAYLQGIKAYNPVLGSFRMALIFGVKKELSVLLGFGTSRQEPLCYADRFEAVPSTGEEGFSLAETVADETAGIPFEQCLDDITREELREELDSMISQYLNEREGNTITGNFFSGKSLASIAEAEGVSESTARNARVSGIRKLQKHSSRLVSFAEELNIIDRYAYNTGLGSFKNTFTSATERAAMKLMNAKDGLVS